MTEIELFEIFKQFIVGLEIADSQVTCSSKLLALPSIMNEVTNEIIFFIISNSLDSISLDGEGE